MMKNKKMGVLAVLVMLVAVTLNAVGGTYAKYISTYGMTDEARVAKWDFTKNSSKNVDLFKNSYTKDGNTVVASSDAWKVIAPGTEGFYQYEVSGTAEVNYKVSNTLKVTNNVKLDNGYDPLEFSVDGITWLSADDFNTQYATDAATNAIVYPANSKARVGGTIYWRWVFETGHDDLDTQLGEKAVKENLTVSAEIGATVEQTQDAATATTDADGNAIVAKSYVSVTNKLTAEEKAEIVALGYKTDYANVTFNGRELKGTVKEYTDTQLLYWFGVAGSPNYFYALNFDVPAGYKLINTTTPTEKTLVDNTAGADVKTGTVIINLIESQGKFGYKLVNADATDEQSYEIDYSGLTFTPAV